MWHHSTATSNKSYVASRHIECSLDGPVMSPVLTIVSTSFRFQSSHVLGREIHPHILSQFNKAVKQTSTNSTMLQRNLSPTPTRTIERKSSRYPSKSDSNLLPHRRLVDYTQCRRDGTASNNANVNYKSSTDPKKAIKSGMPAFRSLESSLDTSAVSPDPSTDTDSETHQGDNDRIEFFLKIVPKSQRKKSRISTLDKVKRRKGGLVRDSLKSSRSLSERKDQVYPATRTVKRSVSTPCAWYRLHCCLLRDSDIYIQLYLQQWEHKRVPTLPRQF